MHIVIDARKIGDGGIGRYVENLVDGLVLLADQRISLLMRPQASLTDSHKRHISSECRKRWSAADYPVEFHEEPSGLYSLSELFTISKRHRQLLLSADVYHSPHYVLPYNIPIPQVVTVHDVVHVSHPENFLQAKIGKRLINSAIRRANAVITVSETSRKEISKIAGSGVDSISVIPNSIADNFKPSSIIEQEHLIRTLKLNSPFALFVGNEKPHKGLGELLQAWSLLKQRRGDVPQLVLAGAKYAKRTMHLIADLNLQNDVKIVGSVSEEVLRALYSSARVVMMPSLIEGFGLPSLEAMCCGAQVICHPIPVLREVCADSAIYTERPGAQGLAMATSALLDKEHESVIRPSNAWNPSQVAEATREVYRSVCPGSATQSFETPYRANSARR